MKEKAKKSKRRQPTDRKRREPKKRPRPLMKRLKKKSKCLRAHSLVSIIEVSDDCVD